MRHTTATSVLAVLALAGSLSACGSDPGAGAGSSTYEIPTSQVEVPVDGISWMQGTTLQVDGRSIDTGVRAESYTLVPDGVLLYAKSRIYFSDTESRAKRVADVSGTAQEGVRASPDGRYVGFLDGLYGPKDKYGDRFLRLDVLDTTTGKQVFASAEGMGDPSEGRNEQYEDHDPELLGLTDDAAYVQGPGEEYWTYPFDGTKPSRVEESEVPVTERGGTVVNIDQRKGLWKENPMGTSLGNVSPSGDLGLADTLNASFAPYDVKSGKPIAFRTPDGAKRFVLGGWLAGDDFWGFASRGPYADRTGPGRIVRCSAKTRVCTAKSGVLRSTSESPVLLGGGYAGSSGGM